MEIQPHALEIHSPKSAPPIRSDLLSPKSPAAGDIHLSQGCRSSRQGHLVAKSAVIHSVSPGEERRREERTELASGQPPQPHPLTDLHTTTGRPCDGLLPLFLWAVARLATCGGTRRPPVVAATVLSHGRVLPRDRRLERLVCDSMLDGGSGDSRILHFVVSRHEVPGLASCEPCLACFLLFCQENPRSWPASDFQ